ncbi:hypothetical protein A8B79_04230 [Balneola sp. EhC07]|nr:hypothetical protein A8B79_04230 [Balneola sp. EhC07]
MLFTTQKKSNKEITAKEDDNNFDNFFISKHLTTQRLNGESGLVIKVSNPKRVRLETLVICTL